MARGDVSDEGALLVRPPCRWLPEGIASDVLGGGDRRLPSAGVIPGTTDQWAVSTTRRCLATAVR